MTTVERLKTSLQSPPKIPGLTLLTGKDGIETLRSNTIETRSVPNVGAFYHDVRRATCATKRRCAGEFEAIPAGPRCGKHSLPSFFISMFLLSFQMFFVSFLFLSFLCCGIYFEIDNYFEQKLFSSLYKCFIIVFNRSLTNNFNRRKL